MPLKMLPPSVQRLWFLRVLPSLASGSTTLSDRPEGFLVGPHWREPAFHLTTCCWVLVQCPLGKPQMVVVISSFILP